MFFKNLFAYVDEFSKKRLLKTKNYSFREPKDGYLVFKKQYTPRVRRFLVFLRNLIKLIIDARDKNEKINRKILVSLGLDADAKIDQLDAFYKKEFRKQKYFYSFDKKDVKRLKEPTVRYFSFFDAEGKKASGRVSNEFFEFLKEGDSQTRE